MIFEFLQTLDTQIFVPIQSNFHLIRQGLLDLDGRNSQKYLHQTEANF